MVGGKPGELSGAQPEKMGDGRRKEPCIPDAR